MLAFGVAAGGVDGGIAIAVEVILASLSEPALAAARGRGSVKVYRSPVTRAGEEEYTTGARE